MEHPRRLSSCDAPEPRLWERLLVLVMPVDYYEVKEETRPKGHHPTMCMLAGVTYLLVGGCFLSLLVFGYERRYVVERIRDKDETTNSPLERREGMKMFTTEYEGRQKCEMLLRLSDEFAFETEDLDLVEDRATYTYYLVRARSTHDRCKRDLKRDPCDDASIDVSGPVAYTGLKEPRGLAVGNGSLVTYARDSETMVQYSLENGEFSTLFEGELKAADYYGITVLDDGMIYVTCASDAADTPQCGLVRYNGDEAKSAFDSVGARPTDLAHRGNVVYIADKGAGQILEYEHRGDVTDEIDPIVAYDGFDEPSRLAVSDSYLWVLDGTKLHRCDVTCELITDMLEASANEIAAKDDYSVFVFDSHFNNLKTVNASSGSIDEIAAGPGLAVTGGTVDFYSAALHDGDGFVYYVTGNEDSSLNRIGVVDDDSGAAVASYAVSATWFVCEGRAIDDPPTTFADMLDYADGKCTSRGGYGYQAMYDLDFFDESRARAYATAAAQSDCEALDVVAAMCDAIDNQPPYLCKYKTKDALFDVFSTAIANTELLFLAAVFLAAVFLTCRSSRGSHLASPRGARPSSFVKVTAPETPVSTNPHNKRYADLEARLAQVELELRHARESLDDHVKPAARRDESDDVLLTSPAAIVPTTKRE